MRYEQVVFSGHAIRRMFERSVSKTEVLMVVSSGEIIAEYPDDDPFPSCLMLGFVSGRPLHVVAAWENDTQIFHVITAYDPDPDLWNADFKTRRPL